MDFWAERAVSRALWEIFLAMLVIFWPHGRFFARQGGTQAVFSARRAIFRRFFARQGGLRPLFLPVWRFLGPPGQVFGSAEQIFAISTRWGRI